MTVRKTGHLTDEQFTDLLMGQVVAPEAAAHLSACAECQQEQRMFMATVEDFNGASLAWMNGRPRVAAVRRPVRGLRWAPAGFAFAALAVGAVFFTAERYANPHVDQIAARHVVAGPVDSADEIARDNRLLQDVALALSTEDEPMTDYRVPAGGGSAKRDLRSRTR